MGIRIFVALALIVLVYWPAGATILSASRGQETAATESMSSGSGGDRVLRPMALASNSAKLVILTELIAISIGVPLGLILFRTDAWGKNGLIWLLAISALIPMPLHASAWLGAFGNAGRMQALGASPFLVGLPGAAIVHALAAIPWVALLSGIGSCAVERELEDLGLLDLSAWQVFGRVTLRRSLGGIAAAGIAVAVLLIGDMTVTDLLQVRTYAEEAYLQYQLGQGPAAAAAVTLPPLVVLGLLIFLGTSSYMQADPERFPSAARRARTWTWERWRLPIGIATTAFVLGLVALPLGSLVWRAGRVGGQASLGRLPYWSFHGLWGTLQSAVAELAGLSAGGIPLPAINKAIERAPWWVERFRELTQGPLGISLIWSGVAATFAVALGWTLCWTCRRSGPWRVFCLSAIAIALATPGPVAGMALVLGYHNISSLYDSPVMLGLAGVLRTFPYACLLIWPELRAFPSEFLDAASVDGLASGGIIRRVALPLTRRSIVAAWWICFVLTLGELPATYLVAPPGHTPLSVVIWGLLHTGVESHLAGVVLVVLVAMSCAGFCATWAMRRLARESC